MKPDPKLFTQDDYDFSKVIAQRDKREWQACYLYEYARESRAARTAIDALRKETKQKQRSKEKSGHYKSVPEARSPDLFLRLLYLSSTTGFPRTPWGQLSDSDRHNVLVFVAALPLINHKAATSHNPPVVFALTEPGTTTLDQWKKENLKSRVRQAATEPIKFGFFAVNLKCEDATLIDDFKKDLRRLRGKAMVEYPIVAKERVPPTGRKGIRDALYALAAMRLRYYCKTFTEARQLLLQNTKQPRYARRDSFNRACDSAPVHFQNVWGGLDKEGPIHLTHGWRQGTHK